MSEISYCRWSTDDFQCDLYIYEDASGGWSTHVAGNRLVWHEGFLPEPVELTTENAEAWANRHMKVMDLLRNGEDSIALMERTSEAYHREDIDLPFAGEYFNDPTPGECADRVEELLALGYRCPSEVVAELRAEQAELDRKRPLDRPSSVFDRPPGNVYHVPEGFITDDGQSDD